MNSAKLELVQVVIAGVLTYGTSMILYSKDISMFGQGLEIASKLQMSTPYNKLLIQTSDSFLGSRQAVEMKDKRKEERTSKEENVEKVEN
ncbi:hypothetical protein E2542_SST24618 [Spatholobus suberectus]|nr:hypothetical protein E2542_SST24618 [Spatholobus suberectus]